MVMQAWRRKGTLGRIWVLTSLTILPRWFRQHEYIEKLNMQALLSASAGHEQLLTELLVNYAKVMIVLTYGPACKLFGTWQVLSFIEQCFISYSCSRTHLPLVLFTCSEMHLFIHLYSPHSISMHQQEYSKS